MVRDPAEISKEHQGEGREPNLFQEKRFLQSLGCQDFKQGWGSEGRKAGSGTDPPEETILLPARRKRNQRGGRKHFQRIPGIRHGPHGIVLA